MSSKKPTFQELIEENSILKAKLAERIKELKCISELSKIADTKDNIHDILTGLISVLKNSWQFPEVAEVKIAHKDSVYTTENFKDTLWAMRSDIIVEGNVEGEILICYLKNKTKYTNPFLKEEFDLLHVVAERLGKIIERLEKTKKYSDLFHTTNQPIVKTDEQGFIREINQASAKLLGYENPEELMGKTTALFYPDTQAREQVIKKLNEAGGELYNLDFLLKRKDGAVIPTLINAKMIYNQQGVFVGILTTLRDMSEQRKTEQALKKSEEKFRNIFENAALGIFKSTPQGKYEIVNDAFARILGFKSPESLLKQVTDISKLYKYPKDRDLIIREFAKKGYVENYEVVANHPEKKAVWISINAKQQQDQDGSVYYVGTIQDITEKKIAENKLKESREEIRKILENSMDAILLTAPDGSVYSANEAACEMFGRTEKEICETGRDGLVDINDPRMDEFLKVRNEKGKAKSEINLFRKDGTVFPAEVSSALFKDKEGKLRSSMIIRDITERKKIEKSLKESEDFLNLTGKIAKVGGWQLIDNFSRVKWTKTTGDIHELPEGVYPALEDAINYYHPDDRDKIRKCVNGAIEKGKPYDVITRLLTAKGNLRWVRAIGRPEMDQGKCVRLTGTFQDITEYKKAEDKLRAVEEERRKSDERFRIAQDMSPDGFTILKPVRNHQNKVIDFTWVYQNKAVAKMNGTDPQKVVGQRLLNLFPGHKDTQFMNAYKNVAESGKPTTFEEAYAGETMKKSKYFRIVVVPMDQNIAVLAQDITERKTIEENLKATINTSPSIIAKANLNTGFYIEANQAVTRILGWSVEEFISKPITDFIHPDDNQITAEKTQKQLEGLEIHQFENRFLCKNGIYKWISWNANSANSDGIVLGVGSDVTQRKEIEFQLLNKNAEYEALNEELRQTNEELFKAKEEAEKSEANLQDAQRMANIGNWRFYLKTGKVEMSDEMINLLGIENKNEAFNISKHEEYYTEESWQRFLEASDAAVNKGKSYEIELEFADKNAKFRYAVARGEPVFDEDKTIIAIKGTLQDITERKQSEEKIRESEEKLRKVINTSPFPVAVIDEKNHNVLIWSKSAILLFGHNPKTTQQWYDLAYPDKQYQKEVKERWNKMLETARKSDRAINTGEYHVRCSNGQIKTCEIYTQVLPGSMIVTLNDVTEQKKAEQEIKAKNEEYEAINEELIQTNEELQIAKSKAEEADRLKTAFLTNMSHEIRTPLNAVLGFSELLTQKELSEGEKKSYSEYIRLNGQGLAKIIDDIIDISKLESNKLPIKILSFNLNTLFNELYSYYSRVLVEKLKTDIRLELEIPEFADKEFIIESDEQRLKQIMNNLLSNAIKYTEKGKIIFGYKVIDTKLHFFVKDTGYGIATENISKIFDRFRQFSPQFVSKHEGTGLGLAICKDLVSLLGGELRVDSELNKGSEFYFQLPLVKAEKPVNNNEPKAVNLKKDLSKYKILIAEDEESNYVLTKRILKPTKVRTDWAKNGKQAVEMVKNNKYDLIIMDIKMPEMDGFEAMQLIKKMNKKIPVIIQTAYAIKEIKEEALEAGCDGFIVKPIDLDDFFEIVNKHI